MYNPFVYKNEKIIHLSKLDTSEFPVSADLWKENSLNFTLLSPSKLQARPQNYANNGGSKAPIKR